MPHPLLHRLTATLGYPLLDAVGFDAFVQAQPYGLLFFSEDPARFAESLDVAAILPELARAFPQLAPALVGRELEKPLQRRYGFSLWPTLVFLREGRYLGSLSRMRNWDDYCARIPQILAGEAVDGLIAARQAAPAATVCVRESE
jgi:hydrogenase-1 operon protein HyaE